MPLHTTSHQTHFAEKAGPVCINSSQSLSQIRSNTTATAQSLASGSPHNWQSSHSAGGFKLPTGSSQLIVGSRQLLVRSSQLSSQLDFTQLTQLAASHRTGTQDWKLSRAAHTTHARTHAHTHRGPLDGAADATSRACHGVTSQCNGVKSAGWKRR